MTPEEIYRKYPALRDMSRPEISKLIVRYMQKNDDKKDEFVMDVKGVKFTKEINK